MCKGNGEIQSGSKQRFPLNLLWHFPWIFPAFYMGQGINFMGAIERKSLSHKSVQIFTILSEAVFLFVTNAVLIPWVKWPMQALFPIDKQALVHGARQHSCGTLHVILHLA